MHTLRDVRQRLPPTARGWAAQSQIPENKVTCGDALFGTFSRENKSRVLTVGAPAPRSAVLTSIREPTVIPGTETSAKDERR